MCGECEPCLLLLSGRGEVAPEKLPHQLSLREKGQCSVRLQDQRRFTTLSTLFPSSSLHSLCCFIYPFPLSRFYRSSGLECWDARDLRRLLLCFEVIEGWPRGGCNVKVTQAKKGDTGRHFLKRQDSSLLAALSYQAHTCTRSSFPISRVLMKS